MSQDFISAAQQQDFLREGYIRLHDAVPSTLVNTWQSIADSLEQQAARKHAEGRALSQACISNDPVGPRLVRYNDVFSQAWEASLELLATPAMLSIAVKLCGIGAVPLQMDILFKQQHPHPVVNWHQGAPHKRNYPYLNIGVYLDDAPEGDGCLRYVPGSQHELLDIQTLSARHGWDIPGTVEQPAQTGDILIQDMMILHGSQPKRSAGARRTIYIELRPYEGILDCARQSPLWADLRKQWMALVLERADQKLVPQSWYDYYPVGEVDGEQLLQALVQHWEPPIPAVWAVFPVEHPDYPVPGDLRPA